MKKENKFDTKCIQFQNGKDNLKNRKIEKIIQFFVIFVQIVYLEPNMQNKTYLDKNQHDLKPK